MMKLRYFLPFLALSATLRTTAAEPPRLVVQIVVSSMRAEDLNRYADNFSDEGFLRLVRGGTFYPESHYDYLHTSTPVSLATLTTGANPSVHGIVAERWIDYVNNNVVELIKDRSAMGIDCDAGIGDCSPRNLVAPTLGESLQQSSPKSLVATVALDPASAVVAGGYTRNVFWMDAPRANWITSSFYAETLPVWARKYNLSREILGYIPFAWELKYPRERYRNSQSTVIDLNKPEHLRRKRHRLTSVEPEKPAPNVPSGIERMLYTPSGNAVTLAFAKQLLTQMRLGKDTAPDLLNICLDAPRRIAESYGPESIEVEDMYYRLDEELAQFLKSLKMRPEQVQDFYPTPGTISTCMFYTELDPYTMKKVYVPKTAEEKGMQRALLQYFKPENRRRCIEALIKAHRTDLIGMGKDCLVKPDEQYSAYLREKAAKQQSGKGSQAHNKPAHGKAHNNNSANRHQANNSVRGSLYASGSPLASKGRNDRWQKEDQRKKKH